MEKASVIFLPVPASLKDDLQSISPGKISTGLKVDPDIPLPVELEQGKNGIDPEDLSWEMILSGMLRVISSTGEDYPDEWIDYYRRFVLTVKPEIYHEFTGASIIKARNGEFDMALEISAVLEGLFPGSPGVLLNKALILEDKAAALEKNGREAEMELNDARDAYEAALALKPLLPDTLFNAGFFFMRRRSFARAKECFTRYINSYDQQEIPKNKKKQAQKIIRDIGNLDDGSYEEAYECISRGKDEEGLIKIREFIERHPKVCNGWFLLGWTLRKLGRFSDGLEALKKASELGGCDCDIRNEMAICLMELGELKEARRELEHALREEPENIKIISNLGVLAMKAGNNGEAAAFFRTVLELDPEDPLAKHYYKFISSDCGD